MVKMRHRSHQYRIDELRSARSGSTQLTPQDIRNLVEGGERPSCTSHGHSGRGSSRERSIVDGVEIDYDPQTSNYEILE